MREKRKKEKTKLEKTNQITMYMQFTNRSKLMKFQESNPLQPHFPKLCTPLTHQKWLNMKTKNPGLGQYYYLG